MASTSTIIWRVNPEEHVRGVQAIQAYHAQQQPRLTRELRFAGIACFVLGGIAAIAWRWWSTSHPPAELFALFGIPSAFGALYLATRPGAVKRAARRQLLDNPLTLQQRRYIFEARGLQIAGETFADTFAWEEVRRVAETPEFLLIFAERSAYYLPKRAISWPESIENVREVLVEAIGDRALVR